MTSVPDAVSPLPRTTVLAAGAVVLRAGGGEGQARGGSDAEASEVLLVHRPRYDDWSLPKGKLHRGEHLTACAVREVAEESGARIGLGVPLVPRKYLLADGRPKTVHYWVARLLGEDPVPGFEPNDEVDAIRWVTWDEAPGVVTHPHDRETLAEARAHARPTSTVLVLRHAQAMERGKFRRTHPGVPDAERPLAPRGRARARGLTSILEAYASDVQVSSPAVRCVGTLHPYLHPYPDPHEDPDGRDRRALQVCPGLSQEGSTPEAVAQVVGPLALRDGCSVVCSHRPVLPWVFSALGVEPVALDPGELSVVHLREGAVVATERHAPE